VELLVTQHPLGGRMMMSRGHRPFKTNTARTRVRYDANTLAGASGSSVIDQNGRLVALHHFAAKGANQGIPISAIARDLAASALAPLTTDV
jgi:V8-like Glu-specific endopeptidase